jgi:hypothetical protein
MKWPCAFVAILAAILLAPAAAHRVYPPEPPHVRAFADQIRKGLVAGYVIGRKLGWAGFVVYPDAAPLPRRTAAMHLSAFQDALRPSAIYHGNLGSLLPPPFSVLMGYPALPRSEVEVSALGPASMIERAEVGYWHVKPEPIPNNSYWSIIVDAQPL